MSGVRRWARVALAMMVGVPVAGAQSNSPAKVFRSVIAELLTNVQIPVLLPAKLPATLRSPDISEVVVLETSRSCRDRSIRGPIDSPKSEGSNLLLRDGAQAIMSPADALALLGLTPPVRTLIDPDDPDQSRVWQALKQGPADLDTLCHRASLPVQRCLAAVTALELNGSIECALTGEVRKR